MYRRLTFVFISFFVLFPFVFSNVNAKEKSEFVIAKYSKDITGDRLKDTIYLIGIPFEQGSLYLKEIFLKISATNGQTYKVEFEGGYEPTVHFKDLNHDGVKDMYVSIATGGSGGQSNYFLYTLKDFQLTNVSVPPTLLINGQFKDAYGAILTIENSKQSYIFNLKDRKNDYDRIGLYENGKLNEPTELLVFPYSTLKPIRVKGVKYGLKGIQRFSGAYSADTIGFIESIWFFENGQWMLKKTTVKSPVNFKKK